MMKGFAKVRGWAGGAVAHACAVAMLASGCATSSRDLESDDRLTASQRVYGLAAQETTASDLVPLAVPAPPGVESATLALRDRQDDAAWMTLAAVVDQYQDRWSAPIESVAPHDPTPEQEREALRHYVKGRDFALRNSQLVAVTELERAEDLDPTDVAILRELARSYVGIGNMSKAVRIYERLLAVDPEHPEARFTLGMVAARRRDFVETVAILGPGALAGTFDHDPAGEILTAFALADALRGLGHDRAVIEAVEGSLRRARPISQPTRYAPQFGSAYRRRGEQWRAVGDAYCRLGEYEAALTAYAESSALPSPDPAALHPRAIFVSLRLGRVRGAHAALLAKLESEPEAIGDRDILLCEYVADHAPPVDLISDAVVALYEQYPDEPGPARASAAFLPPEEALELLNDFVRRRPDDREVVAQLLGWLAQLDLESAVAFTVTLCRDNPDRADAYARQFFGALSDPAAALVIATELDASPAQVFVECTLRSSLGDLGRAWSTCAAARRRWPDDASLALLQVGLAAGLREPELVARAADDAAALDTAAAWLAISRASMLVGDTDRAMEAAGVVVDRDRTNADAWMHLSRAQTAASIAATDAFERREYAERAVVTAEEVLQLEPARDEAFDVLLGVYGPDGALEDLAFYRQTAQRLLESDTESVLYRRLAAREAITQRRFDDALERLLGLYEADPSDRQSLNLAMMAWTGLGRLDEAQRWIERRLHERPGDPALLEQWVRVQVRQDRGDDVLSTLHTRLDANPNDVVARRLLESVYRALGRGEEALRYGEARLLERPPGVKRELDLAVIYADAGRTDEALERLEWFADHAEPATFEYLVRALAITIRLDETSSRDALRLRLAEEIVRRFPEAPLSVYAAALVSLSRLAASEDRFDVFVASATSAHAERSGSLEAAMRWLELAQALVDAGMPAAAGRVVRARFDSGALLEPEAYGLLVRAAIAADAADENGIDRTLRLIRRLDDEAGLAAVVQRSQPPTLDDALREVSIVYSIVGNDAGAEQLMVEALRLDPDDAMLMNNLGYTRIEAGRSDPETLDMIERAIRIEPDDENILDTVGWLRYKQGRFEEAEEDDGAALLIRRSIDRAEVPSPEVYDHLGDLLWRVDGREEALQAWRRASGILDDVPRQQRILREYLLLQTRGWGLLVADPQEMYDRDFGLLHERLKAKIEAVERGEEPELAPTFAELAARGAAN